MERKVKNGFKIIFVFNLVCLCVSVHTCDCMLRVSVAVREWSVGVDFLLLDPDDQIQVVRLSSRHLYSVSHLPSPERKMGVSTFLLENKNKLWFLNVLHELLTFQEQSTKCIVPYESLTFILCCHCCSSELGSTMSSDSHMCSVGYRCTLWF